MIDEPLALLAEAFGQDAEPVVSPVTESGPSAEAADLAVIVAAPLAWAEGAILSL